MDDEVLINSPKSRVTPKSHFGRIDTIQSHNHKQTIVTEADNTNLLVSGSSMKKTITKAMHPKSRQNRLSNKTGSG